MTTGSNAWIVGASSGIGRELALALAARGCRVAISARGEDGLAAVCGERPGALVGVPFDVLDTAALERAADSVEAGIGRIDLLVCSAAYWRMGGLAETTPEDFRRTLETNVLAPFTLVRHALARDLLNPGATVVLLSSVAGFNGLPNAVAYGSSKAALTHMAESLRFDLDRLGFRLVVVHPGFVDTPMTADNPFPMPLIMPAAEAARRILRGLDGDGFEIVFPRRLGWALKFLRMLPCAIRFPLLKRLTGHSSGASGETPGT